MPEAAYGHQALCKTQIVSAQFNRSLLKESKEIKVMINPLVCHGERPQGDSDIRAALMHLLRIPLGAAWTRLHLCNIWQHLSWLNGHQHRRWEGTLIHQSHLAKSKHFTWVQVKEILASIKYIMTPWAINRAFSSSLLTANSSAHTLLFNHWFKRESVAGINSHMRFCSLRDRGLPGESSIWHGLLYFKFIAYLF